MSNENKKARHWTFIIYPESVPENWRSILQETGCEVAISPLHDKDINEATQEVKKPHYHCIISYANTTTFNSVKTLLEGLNSPIPQAINSVKGILRYFTHQDNPEKHQYNAKDITTINGFDIDLQNELTATEKYQIKTNIIKYIKDNDIRFYADLIEKLIIENYDWFKVAIDNTLLFNTLINSYRDRQRYKKVDSETGEIIYK